MLVPKTLMDANGVMHPVPWWYRMKRLLLYFIPHHFRLYHLLPYADGWRWFNASAPQLLFRWLDRCICMRLYNCFNHHTADGEHWWGVGILQIARRHLFYVGDSGISILFLGQSE
jgi:hypothetical protein